MKSSGSPPFVPPPGRTSRRPLAWEVGNLFLHKNDVIVVVNNYKPSLLDSNKSFLVS